jgi:hypothetical protein
LPGRAAAVGSNQAAPVNLTADASILNRCGRKGRAPRDCGGRRRRARSR